ncbi:non-ribosomal peptide synthetase [Aliiglaciecola lipolytica]|uniref:Carrier domain-containing protein n=1 Tax=Aliiglaciecola lipolytica E3 TaxID=1127673 RepID=K6YQV2_9ALTE|nr:non-ribosomal peptide synthetase [Aliiglaciecola lipolytica]GAC13700.1 hypothetical protein GLIP_1058 [Aliiglaciecola lipolytica E3]
MHGSNFEQLISDHPGITDFFLHNKADKSGKSKSILFVVVDEFYAEQEIQNSIFEFLPPNHSVDFVVPVTTIPLNQFGEIDTTALDSLYIFEQNNLNANLEQHFASHNRQDAVALLTPNSFDTPPLYLNDLIQVKTSPQNTAKKQQKTSQVNATTNNQIAYSDGGKLDVPDNAPKVLVDCLLRAASANNGNNIVSYKQGVERSLDYPQLLEQASKVLCGLRKQGHKVGSPFIFQFADNAEFLINFWGCLLGGFVPVPMALAADYQNDQSAIDNLQRVSAMLGNAAILTSTELHADISAMQWLQQKNAVPVINCTELQSNSIDSDYYQASEEDVTLIMLTSGTTGTPKGVPLTHKNLISRSIGSVQVNGFSEQTRSLNWMPLDHVAGIIFFHLRDVYLGCTQVHVAAADILAAPLSWIDLLEQHQASVTFAPNFAFGLIAGLSEEIAQRNWDLSALKLVLNGGEAVVASTARQFLQLFESSGLSKHAMCPAWGMSETSSGITYARDFELDNTSDSDSHVSVGPPMPGDFMRITDAQNQVLNEGDVGRLQVKGHTVFHGYYQNPEANEEAFTEDGWFNTGDLGILVDGKLTITGREKDVIIVNGVNYSGPEIESIVEDIEQISRSFAAACAVADPHQGGKECLAIFFVCDGNLTASLLRTIKGQVTSKAGVSPQYLVPLQRDQIPKTSIGKIQRTKLKNSFEAGHFYQQIKTADMLLGNHCIPAWLFQPSWQLTQPVLIQSLAQKKVVIFAHQNTISIELVNQLKTLGAEPILVTGSDTLSLNGNDPLQIRSVQSEDYTAAMAHIAESDNKTSIDYVLCLWSLQDEDDTSTWDENSPQLYSAIVACAAGICSYVENDQQLQLMYVTQGAQSWQSSQVTADNAGLPALIKTLKQELPDINYVHIDLALNEPDAASKIIIELQSKQAGKDIIWSNQQRFSAELNPCRLTSIETDPLAPNQPAGFVLSGGLGGIGQQLIKTLLHSAHAKILIIGRSSLEDVKQQHVNLSKWLKSTANLSYVTADVTNSEAVNLAVKTWLSEQQVTLHSIFHLAGGYHEATLQEESVQGFSDLAVAKLAGANSFANILTQFPAANLINFSSTAGVFGGATIGAYAAASCALDGLSHNLRQQGLRCFDINWSSWRSTGMSEGNTAIEALRARGILELDIEAALNSLRLILGQGEAGQYIVGLDPQNPIIRRLMPNCLNSLTPTVFSSSEGTAGSEKLDFVDNFAQSFETPLLQIDKIPLLSDGQVDEAALTLIATQGNTEVVPAKTETEKAVVEIWKKILNLDTVSIQWNFFDVGGQSITATKLIAAIRTQFAVNWTLKDIFSAATCEQQAAAIEQIVSQSESNILEQADIPILDRSEPLPLSSAQKRLWFIEQLDIPSSAYNVTASIRFDHTPEHARLEQCLEAIMRSQESLRVVFPSLGGVPKQHVLESVSAHINTKSVASISEYNQLLISEGRFQFDLTHGPLLRATLVNFEDEFTLVLTLHHIISDGWSMRVLFQQFEAIYTGQKLPVLPANSVQYADYAAWQQGKLEKGDYQQQLAYWQQNLKGALSGFGIPTDFPRPQVQTYNGKRIKQCIPAKLSGQLQEFAKQRNKTSFVLLLTAFKVLLARYAQQSDVLVGTVVANRDFAQVENLIGFFVNPVVLRTDVSKQSSFEQLLDAVNHTTLDAVANHNIPFEYLADKLQPPRDTSRSPLFQIAFDFRDPDLTRSENQQLSYNVMEADLGTAKYDLHLTLEEAGSEILAYWEYNTDLFAAQTIERMTLNYQRLLENVINAPEQTISSIDLLSPVEITLQNSWNQTDAPYKNALCMHQLFELAVQNRGDEEALRFGNQSLTYKQLNQKANQLARELITHGAVRNGLVAMCVERSLDTVICVLAILKSGAAYMALDPSYPQQRLDFMLADSGASLLLTRGTYADKFASQNIKTVTYDDSDSVSHHDPQNLDINSNPHDLAYVIYTSGSTGTPKGVMLEHGGWCNIAQAQIDSFGLQPGMRILQFASMSFDASAFELAMAWGSQGTLVMGAKEAVLPGPALANLLNQQHVQVVTLPPTALSALGDESLPDLKVITVAGEACSAELVQKWAGPERRFFNLYGPTETTIWASYAECYQSDEGLPVIGKPVANTQLFVLDEQLNRLPAGMPGELGIAGVGVARGYINRADLTAERFIENQFSNSTNSKIYRSGDLVKYRADGNLEFLGRIDHQVKVRGFRIELGEIEAVLRKYPNVTEAVVVAHQTQAYDKTLFAYVSTVNSSNTDALAIREFLKESLTDYMVPSQVFVLDSLPLSLNGKVDRKALPSPESLRAKTQTTVSNASSSMESLVSDIWKNVLDLDAIDINQNFFDIGGHSLKMAQVQTQLVEKLNKEVSLVDLFQYTTIKTLANYLDSLSGEKSESTPKVEKQKSKVSGQQRLAKMAAMKKRQGR